MTRSVAQGAQVRGSARFGRKAGRTSLVLVECSDIRMQLVQVRNICDIQTPDSLISEAFQTSPSNGIDWRGTFTSGNGHAHAMSYSRIRLKMSATVLLRSVVLPAECRTRE